MTDVLGIGTDIIEIERIRSGSDKHGTRFSEKIFTENERAYCDKHADPAPHYAARFSAKEAIVKAIGTGIGEHVSWQDLEILNDDKGRPWVYFSEKLQKLLKGTQVLISFSHCHAYATATAVWVRKVV